MENLEFASSSSVARQIACQNEANEESEYLFINRVIYLCLFFLKTVIQRKRCKCKCFSDYKTGKLLVQHCGMLCGMLCYVVANQIFRLGYSVIQ